MNRFTEAITFVSLLLFFTLAKQYVTYNMDPISPTFSVKWKAYNTVYNCIINVLTLFFFTLNAYYTVTRMHLKNKDACFSIVRLPQQGSNQTCNENEKEQKKEKKKKFAIEI